MDMNKWIEDVLAAEKKKALPVLSFPAGLPSKAGVGQLGPSNSHSNSIYLPSVSSSTALLAAAPASTV